MRERRWCQTKLVERIIAMPGWRGASVGQAVLKSVGNESK